MSLVASNPIQSFLQGVVGFPQWSVPGVEPAMLPLVSADRSTQIVAQLSETERTFAETARDAAIELRLAVGPIRPHFGSAGSPQPPLMVELRGHVDRLVGAAESVYDLNASKIATQAQLTQALAYLVSLSTLMRAIASEEVLLGSARKQRAEDFLPAIVARWNQALGVPSAGTRLQEVGNG